MEWILKATICATEAYARAPANAVLSVIFSPKSKADNVSTDSRLALFTGATFEATISRAAK